MSLTTAIALNALLDVFVIVGLFRVMWFGISKPYEQPSAPRLRQRRREATAQSRAQQRRAAERSRVHERHVA